MLVRALANNVPFEDRTHHASSDSVSPADYGLGRTEFISPAEPSRTCPDVRGLTPPQTPLYRRVTCLFLVRASVVSRYGIAGQINDCRSAVARPRRSGRQASVARSQSKSQPGPRESSPDAPTGALNVSLGDDVGVLPGDDGI